MSCSLTTAAIVCLFALTFFHSSNANYKTDPQWQQYKDEFNKTYDSVREEVLRYRYWKRNVAEIELHNAGHRAGQFSYYKGVNHLADRSPQERQHLRMKPVPVSSLSRPPSMVGSSYSSSSTPGPSISSALDNRGNPCMPPIKDQGDCGGCWAFASTAPLEYQKCQQDSTMVLMSEQNLIDCSGSYGNIGCEGGMYTNAWSYVQSQGIESEDSYPYTGVDGQCLFNSANTVATDYGFNVITDNMDEEAMKQAVYDYGLVSVSVDASGFDFYQGGVYTGEVYNSDGSISTCSQTDVDHAVVLVGYGYDTGSNLDYWIVRNSWSTLWGMEGYMFLQYGVNLCAVATYPAVPVF